MKAYPIPRPEDTIVKRMAKQCALKHAAKVKSKVIIALVLVAFLSCSLVGSASAIGSPFLNKDVMLQQWITLCNGHTQWASYESVGKTVYGKNIYVFKIGTPSAPRIMYDGEVHATEDSGTEVMYTFAKWLLESGDSRATRILQTTYHMFIPIVNRDIYGAKTNAHGVDLNRNGVYGWGQTGSSDPSSSDYRGPYAGSEPETQALRSAWQRWRPVFYINTHHGYHFASHVSNTALEQQVVSLYQQKASAMGANDPYIFGQGAGGGLLATDADMSFGVSGWSWEVLRWQDLVVIQGATNDPKVAAQMLMTKVYDDAFPLLLSFAGVAAGTPSLAPSPTPSPTLSPAPTSPGTLTVTSPNGGESWKRGTVQTITWSRSGSPGPYVKIELLKSGVISSAIASNTDNDGFFSWTLPSKLITGTDYKVRITSAAYSSITDLSNSDFRITTRANIL
jgi:Zinc carboxypeptidase/Kre9/KNH-like N-terminal Ig-like domain